MAYDPTLADALSRVRAGVGDIDTTMLLPDATYTALLAQTDATEASATRAAAAMLAAFYAAKPTDVSLPSGLRVAWAKRIEQWNRIADGLAGAGVSARAGAFSTALTRRDGYAVLADEDAV